MLYVNTNFAIDHFVLEITWITVLQKYFVACEVRVNLNYSTEVHFNKQENMAANLATCSRLRRNSSYFQH